MNTRHINRHPTLRRWTAAFWLDLREFGQAVAWLLWSAPPPPPRSRNREARP